MNKFLQLAGALGLLGLVSMSVNGETLSPQEALSRALKSSSAAKMKKSARQDEMRLSYTSMEVDGGDTPMVYVFSKGADNGFVVASADDRFPALLGYSDSGSFSESEMPPAMKWWLSEYAREMADAIGSEGKNRVSAFEDDNREPVAPLLKSKWNQNSPYNLLTPKVGTSSTMTGCVATAMAQVMYYHKWPDVGIGSNAYEWQPSSSSAKTTLSYDFSAKPFDWSNMLDEYDGTYSTAQANAVAELMLACGMGVDMNYGTSSSGAQSSKQHLALMNYFKYSGNIRYQQRCFCDSKEWEDLIYDNLSKQLPVLYHGSSDGGGHSFVCDGYAGDHYYHFNWGWGGSSDGYFLLYRLNPKDLGIGAGSGGGYNENQGITYNIYPAKEGETVEPQAPFFACTNDFGFAEEKVSQSTGGSMLTFCYFDGGFYNKSDVLYSGCLGVILEDIATGERTPYVGRRSTDIKPNYGYKQLAVYLDEAPAGNYRVFPGVTYSTADIYLENMRVANGCNDYLLLTVDSNGKRTFTTPTVKLGAEDAPELMTTLFSQSPFAYSRSATSLMMSFANVSANKDYYGDLTMMVTDLSGDLKYEESFQFNIPAATVIPYSAAISFPLDAGDYLVSFKDGYDRVLPGEYPLTLKAPLDYVSTDTDAELVSLSPLDFAPAKNAEDKVKFTFKLKNTTSSVLEKPAINLILYNDKGVQMASWIWTFSASMNAGSTWNLGGQVALYASNLPLPVGVYRADVRRRYTNSLGTNVYVYLARNYTITIGYPVESVNFASGSCYMKAGETSTLTAGITPADASFKQLAWSSSDTEVAEVNNEGVVTAKKEGSSYIIATSANGCYDVCQVNVTETSAVEDILNEGAEIIAVYTPSGTKVADHPSSDEVKALAKGIYVVVTDKGSFKLAR